MKLTPWLRHAGALAVGVVTAMSCMPLPTARAQEKQNFHFFVGFDRKFGIDARLQGVPKVLDEQLQLGGEGALVLSVGEGGPADKGGLKANDIVLSVNEKQIKGLSELLVALNRSEGKNVTLKVLRAGKPQFLTVTPAATPSLAGPHFDVHANLPSPPKLGEIEVELQSLEKKIREKLQAAGVDVRLQLIRPGTITADANYFIADSDAKRTAPAFPEDLNVEIHKHGNGPADIEVKRGDQTWKIKETELDQLPAELRPHVMSLLGRGPKFMVTMPPGVPHMKRFATAGGGGPESKTTIIEEETKSPDGKSTKKSVDHRLHVKMLRRLDSNAVSAQLDQMSHDLNRLHHQMDQLRRSLQQSRPGPDVIGIEKAEDEEVVKEVKEKEAVEETNIVIDVKEVEKPADEKAAEEKKP